MHALNDCTLNAQLFKKASGFKPWLYKLSVEACAFLSRPYNPIALIVFRLFKEFSNLNHTCPYEGALIVKGFYLRSEILPNAMPTGEYMLNVTWNVYKRAQAVTLVYFMYNEDLN
ncbi:maker50 [Drosophila busckii]|uniref:Maker50 n=1 Tax=Drosophila busckii TaxID=30019 RepID=A0A0M5IXD1_DROBS|nr:maker50 [Drosophila busckii]